MSTDAYSLHIPPSLTDALLVVFILHTRQPLIIHVTIVHKKDASPSVILQLLDTLKYYQMYCTGAYLCKFAKI